MLSGTTTNHVVNSIDKYTARTICAFGLVTPTMASARNAATAPNQPTEDDT